MQILVMCQDQAEKYSLDEPHILISVASPGSDGAKIQQNSSRLETLRLFFHDIVSNDADSDLGMRYLKQYGVEPVFFSDAEATAIVELLDRHKTIGHVLVNCEMGISRSAGIAAAIARVKLGDDDSYFERYCPNRRVYEMMLRKLGCNEPIDLSKWNNRLSAEG